MFKDNPFSSRMRAKEFAEDMANVSTAINEEPIEKDILVKYSSDVRSIIGKLNGKKVHLQENIERDTEELRRTNVAIDAFNEAERKLKNGVKVPFVPASQGANIRHKHTNINLEDDRAFKTKGIDGLD